MLDAVRAALACPVCARGLDPAPSGLSCPAGHAYDRARQGYVNLAAGLGRLALGADDAAAVAARADFLGAGHFAPVTEALASAAAAAWPGAGLVLDAGAGTGHHLAAVLDALPRAAGLAVDSSPAALRRAARAHPRAAAAGWDLRAPLPVRDGSVGVLLNVFAPRNGASYARALRPDGALLVLTPGPGHLAELIGPLGLLDVDADKRARLAAALDPHFRPAGDVQRIHYVLRLARPAAAAVAAMGPSAHHITPAELAGRLAAMPDPVDVTVEVDLSRFAPIPR